MKIKKIIKFIFLMLFILIIFAGCGELKTSEEIKEYLKNKYDINVRILSEKKGENYIEYTVKEWFGKFEFTCTTSVAPSNIDGNEFGMFESTEDDYYSHLTKFNEQKILKIAEKYNVELEESESGLIGFIKVNTDNIDFNNTSKVANELMKIYKLKKEVPKIKNDLIYIVLNDEKTMYHYKYTSKGNETLLCDFRKELFENWNIPEKIDDDINSYINKIYNGENLITNIKVNTRYEQDQRAIEISYKFKNIDTNVQETFVFDATKYKYDLENNRLRNMENYLKENIPYL